MNASQWNQSRAFAARLCGAVFLLIAATCGWAQDSEQDAGAVERESSASAPAQSEPTGADVPVQSLTGPLELLVHPDYPPDQARLVYQPLIDYLNSVEGLTVELAVSRNFHRYWIDARRNQVTPLVLEDAHMAAWRMQEFDYTPLVTTADTLTYSLLTGGALADEDLGAFTGRPIASLPSPSLGYLVLARWFPNPLQQPRILSTATSWLDAVEMVFSAEADAAVAPENLAERYPNLVPVATSDELPGLTLSAGPEVPEDIRERLVEALTVLHDNAEHHAALFELDVDRFVAADPADYRGLEDWLSSIFGI